MRKQEMGAVRLLPLMAGMLAVSGCASAYPELQQDISQAVAAAQPTAADSAAARGPAVPAAAPAASGANAVAPTTASTSSVPAAGGGNVVQAASSPAATGAVSSAAMTTTAMPTGGAVGTRLTMVANLPAPEAAVIDTAAGMVLVAGSEPTATGSRGIIMRMDMQGTLVNPRWIVGGVKSAILRTPRGMAIVGDTLWVVDGTVLRAFSRKSGTPIVTIPMGVMGAVSLSDVAVGGDGVLYVADAATTYSARGVAQRKGAGKIFRVSARKPEIALEHARLRQPTSLSWDPIMSRLLIAAATSDTIIAWRPGQGGPETVAVSPGPWDGVISIGGMVFYAMNSARGEVQQFQNGMTRRMVEGARGAGDMALDVNGGRLVVPIPGEQRVEIWQVRR